MTRARTVVLGCVLAVSGVGLAADENWPQWRGPGGQGVSSEMKVPTDWQPDRNIAWKTALPGSGHSSPVVWGNRIFLTAACMPTAWTAD